MTLRTNLLVCKLEVAEDSSYLAPILQPVVAEIWMLTAMLWKVSSTPKRDRVNSGERIGLGGF